MANDPILEVLKGSSALGVLQRLTNSLPYLSETEKRLVTYILEHPGEVVGMSVAELASKAGVGGGHGVSCLPRLRTGRLHHPPGSTGRSARPVWRSLQHACSVPGALRVGRGRPHGRGVRRDAGPSRCVHHCARRRRPGGAGHLPVRTPEHCGHGRTLPRIAEMAIFCFQRLGITSMLWIDASVVNVTSDAFHPMDVVIGISHSGENEALARFMGLAREKGATTIAITNYGRSQVAGNADIPLVTSFREERVGNFDLIPRMSQLLLLQLLLDRVRVARGA